MFRDRVGRATTTQSMFGISVPSVSTAVKSRVKIMLELKTGILPTAVDKHRKSASLEHIDECAPLHRGRARVHVACVYARLAERIRQRAYMRKVHAEHERRPTVCRAVEPRLHDKPVHSRRVDDVREARRVEVACTGVDRHAREVDVCAHGGEAHIAEPKAEEASAGILWSANGQLTIAP